MCVGVLLESHIYFHTWPEEGFITFDLFTCGPNPLLPSLGDIERLFAVPQPHAGKYQPFFPRLRHDSDDDDKKDANGDDGGGGRRDDDY